MKGRSVALIITAAAVLAGAGWYRYTPLTLRYKLTISVQHDGKIVAGSGVVDTLFWKHRFLDLWLGQPVWLTDIAGEAVVVDLGPRGRIFALLTTDPDRPMSNGWPTKIAIVAVQGDKRGPVEDTEALARILSVREPRPLPTEDVPLLVKFRDPETPSSLERVDPKNLAASFGPDVTLVGATVQIVQEGVWPFNRCALQDSCNLPRWLAGEPVTREIDRKLPWLASMKKAIGVLNLPPHGSRNTIFGNSFSQGIR
jgi:hypothetical protein